MEAQTLAPMKADFASVVTLAQELGGMSREQMIIYANQNMGLTVDPTMDPQTIKENLLRIAESSKNNARDINAKSLNVTIALDKTRKAFMENWDGRKKQKPFEYEPNPPVQVKFFFMQHVGVDLEFVSSEPYGIKGDVNKFGFKQHMKYHLFHGEMYVLPLLLIKHLEKKIYVTHKPVIDPGTGLQSGAIPIIKPRFVFQQVVSSEESVMLAEFRANQLKEAQNETQGI